MTLLFHDESDLIKVRPDIMNYGITDFNEQLLESENIIIRTLEHRWYRNRADDYGLNWRNTPFDATLLLTAATQLKRLAVYKSLQLIYLFIQKETPEPDAFERQSNSFKKLYAEELKEVLDSGLDYDWSGTGSIDSGENIQPRIRRLFRV
jgi:hypothetical protein